ncbi:MAG: carbohydrate-binding family 9-like protein [Myxococcota bacterium]
MIRRLLLLALLTVLVMPAGCKKPRKQVLSSEQRDEVRGAISTSATTPQVVLDANFDGKVRLVGYDMTSQTVKAGETFEITWHWEALADLKGDWKIFVHFESPGRKRTVHDHQPVAELHPMKKWKKGEFIKDTQRIRVSKDFPNGIARIFIGVFDERAWSERSQNIRMAVTNKEAVKGSVDKDNRVQAVQLTITGSKAGKGGKKQGAAADRRAKRPSKLVVYRASEAPTIDGKLGEADWRKARPTKALGTPDGRSLGPRHLTQFRAMWDDSFLYIAASCRDDDIYNDKTGRDATLWEQDVVEVYLDPGKDGKDYIEIQVSPAEQLFDAVFATHRNPKWQEAAKALDIKGMVAKVEVDGSLNQRADAEADRRWTMEMKIPWAELPGVTGPPADGAVWAANFYRIDVKSPKRAGFMGAWSPAGGDFHNTKGFGSFLFKNSEPPSLKRGPAVGPGGGAAGVKAAKPGLVPKLKSPTTKVEGPSGLKLAPKGKAPQLPAGPTAPSKPTGK